MTGPEYLNFRFRRSWIVRPSRAFVPGKFKRWKPRRGRLFGVYRPGQFSTWGCK